MNAVRPAIVSERDFLSLPTSMDKVELLDGEVVVSPSPSFRHQEVLRRIVFALGAWASKQASPIVVGQAPLDIRFGANRILQPDAFVILDEVSLDVEGPLQRVPELCVEVLSSDRLYDRLTKRLIYAGAGVREYWVVEQVGPIERWHGDGLAVVEELDERLVTPLLPGFELDLRALFE